MNKMKPKAFLFELNLIITGSINSKLSGEEDTIRRYGWLFFYSQITDETRCINKETNKRKFKSS